MPTIPVASILVRAQTMATIFAVFLGYLNQVQGTLVIYPHSTKYIRLLYLKLVSYRVTSSNSKKDNIS